MIKENQKILNRTFIMIDVFNICSAYIFSWFIRFKSGIIPNEGVGTYLTLNEYMKPLLILVPVYLVLYDLFKLYVPHRTKSIIEEIINLIKANILGILIFILFLYIKKEINFSRYFIMLFAINNVICGFLERGSIRYILRRIRRKGKNLKHILIIGYSDLTFEILQRIQKNKQWGYNVLGIVDDFLYADKCSKFTKKSKEQIAASKTLNISEEKNDFLEGIEVLGDIKGLEKVFSRFQVDEIFVALSIKDYDRIRDIIETSEKWGVRTYIIPDYYKYIPARPYVEEVDGLPIINIRYLPLDNIINKTIKRIFDISASIICLIIFSPLMALTAAIIKITSKGPVIYRQERIGINNKPFIMYKFRSMHIQDEDEEKFQWTKKDDPRKTKFGSFIRRTSIDELPQLFNVLKGDMSLVGPRPERPFFVEKFKEEIPKYMVKHQVRPGITGWAQVNGLRGDTSIKKRIEYDLYYLENWSFIFDIKIMFLTIFKGFINKNAY